MPVEKSFVKGFFLTDGINSWTVPVKGEVKDEPPLSCDILCEVPRQMNVRRLLNRDLRVISRKREKIDWSPSETYELLDVVIQQIMQKYLINWKTVEHSLKINKEDCKKQFQTVFKLDVETFRSFEALLLNSGLKFALPSNLKLEKKVILVEKMLKEHSKLFVNPVE